MIEINLLTPHRAKRFKRKVEIQSQVILAAAVISVTLLICGFFWIRLNDKVDSLNAETTRLSGELAGLQTKVKEVKNYERDKNIVREKIKVIEQLRKNQSVPVHLLDEISKSLPQRAWLISLTEQSGTVDLSGNAITNNEIVEFINNLKRSTLFGDVQILESRRSLEGKIPIYSFRLKGTILS